MRLQCRNNGFALHLGSLAQLTPILNKLSGATT
jgi:hypothetical protein